MWAVAFWLSKASWWFGATQEHWTYLSQSAQSRTLLAQVLFCGIYIPTCALVLDRSLDRRLAKTSLFLSTLLIVAGVMNGFQALLGLVSLLTASSSDATSVMDFSGVKVFALISTSNLLVGIPLAFRFRVRKTVPRVL
jgi:hypothetical protein